MKLRKSSINFYYRKRKILPSNPESGKPLRGRLHGIWQIGIGPFRVWYEINHVNRVVILKAILYKDEAIRRY